MKIHGLLAEFDEAEPLIDAVKRARKQGYREMDAYAPFPVQGLDEALGFRKSGVPPLALTGGILGGVGGYFMQWYASAVDYPILVAGRPLHSWPAFIPVTFELTVLGSALFAAIGMIVLNRLPEPYHPVFTRPEFDRASSDRFFLCIRAIDPDFDLDRTRDFLHSLGALQVTEVQDDD